MSQPAGIDPAHHLGAGHAEPGFGLVGTIHGTDLRWVLRPDNDCDALGSPQLQEGVELPDRRQLGKFIQEQPNPPIPTFAQGWAADRGSEQSQYAPDPDAGKLRVTGPAAGSTAGERTDYAARHGSKSGGPRDPPTLCQDGDDSHVGLEGCQNAQSRFAIGLIEQP